MFPVIHSLASGAALIENVLCNYQITAHRCLLLKRGLNDTYLVITDADRYILRVYRHRWRTKTEIDFELELLTFLHQHHQPISYPITTKSGKFTQAICAPEGQRYTALFSYAPGRAIGKNINCEQSYQLGKVVATIHQTTNNFRSSFHRQDLNCAYLLDWAMNAILPLFKHQNDINYLQQQSGEIKRSLVTLQLSKQPPTFGICIGDVHSENAHFSELNQPTLFDFDQCGYGWRAFDIAKFLHTTHAWKLDASIRNSFLDGYQSIRQLSVTELTAIPILLKVAHIWVMGISCAAVEDVLPYGWFTDEWFNAKLGLLRSLQ